MKKIFTSACISFFLFFASQNLLAQRSLGIGASYSTGLQATSLQLKFNTSFSEKLSSSIEFDHFFLSGENKWQTVSLHFAYNIVHSEQFNFYLLGGGHFFIYESEDVLILSGDTYNGMTYSTDFTINGSKASDIGGRLGLGFNKFFNENLMFYAETKITFNPRIEDLSTFLNLTPNQIIPSVGLAYQF